MIENIKKEIYTSGTYNGFHTIELTEFGRTLYNKSIVTSDTMLLNIRETVYNDHKIVFQKIDRAMFKLPAPSTFDITITKIDQNKEIKEVKENKSIGKSWWLFNLFKK